MPSPQFFYRLFAWGFDCVLGSLLFHFLLSQAKFLKIFSRLTQELMRVLGLDSGSFLDRIDSETFVTCLFIYVLTQMIRFYLTLVFGRTLGQIIINIRYNQTFLWSRLGGAFCIFIGTLLGPFLIFDLPSLWGKMTFKEILTYSRPDFSQAKVLSMTSILCFPIVLYLFCVAPLMQNILSINAPRFDFEEIKKFRLEKKGDYSHYKNYWSKKYHFNILSSLAENRFMLIPSFAVYKEGNKKVFKGFVNIFDKKYQTFAKMKLTKKISLLSLLAQAKIFSPFFGFHYPHLNALMYSQKEYVLKKDGPQKVPSFKRIENEDIKNILMSSLNTNLSSPFRGEFFLRGPVKLRSIILSLLKVDKIPHIDFIQIGDHLFLKLSGDIVWGEENPKIKLGLVPIETENSHLIEFVWDKSEHSKLSQDAFFETFLNLAKWSFDDNKVYNLFETPEDWGPFSFLDYFTDEALDQKTRLRITKFIVYYFYDLSKQARELANENLKTIIIRSLERILLLIDIKNQKKAHFFDGRISFELNKIKVELQNI